MGFVPDYCVFDLETTGFSPREDRIIEIGVMVVRDGLIAHRDSILIKIVGTLSPRIVELTGITDKQLQRGVPIQNALVWFSEIAGNLPIVGHNILKFDIPFLKEEAARTRVDLSAIVNNEHVFDTAAIYLAQRLGATRQKGESHRSFAARVFSHVRKGMRYNLTEACQNLGVPIDEKAMHRAGADVAATQKLFEAMQVIAARSGMRAGDVTTKAQEKAILRDELPVWMAATL